MLSSGWGVLEKIDKVANMEFKEQIAANSSELIAHSVTLDNWN